jgi:histidinol phosphatase-like enzyme (inositol monophosphatase family)
MEREDRSIALSDYLEFAKALAIEAGRITLKYFRRNVVVEYKSDTTPVTIADRETERFMRSAIRQRYPQHGILGEEDGETNPGAEWRWVLDPIDGTQAFIHGVPLYTVLIALETKGESMLGVIHCPPLEETVAAAAGCGCTFNGQLSRVSQVNDLAQARVNVTDYADFMRRNPKFALALLSQARMCRGWGDAYSYLLVASGRAEIGLDPVVALWDCAPLRPIIAEAGGRYSDFRGRETLQASTALASNGRLHDQLLDLARLDFNGHDQ